MVVAVLDAVEIKNAEGVGADEAVECKDLVHLNRGDESAATLANDVGDWEDNEHKRNKNTKVRGTY